MPKLGIADLFGAIVISSEVGFDKPQPEIFHLALDALDVAPEAAVHIGDDDVDVDGAISAGIRPVRIVRGNSGDASGPETKVTSLRELLTVI